MNMNNEEVLIVHEFDAPRDLVFQAWSDPAHLKNWYAPDGCDIQITKFDFRPGGKYLHCIFNEAMDCWCMGTFSEIVKPEKIVFDMTVADENGKPAQPSDVGMDPEWPASTTVTILFESVGHKTRVTLHQTVALNLAKRTGAYPSWLNMMDKLENELAKMSLVP